MWAIPDCFSGQFPLKTLKSYVALRNAIIHLYMEFPQSYLNVTSIVYSEMFEAFRMWDHWDVVRIHAFLEHWGIINFANDGHLLAEEFVPEKKTEMVGKYSPVRRQELLPLKDRGLNRVDLNVYRRIHGIPEYRGLDAMPRDVLYEIYGFCDIATRGKLHRSV
jgi:SWIRM domain